MVSANKFMQMPGWIDDQEAVQAIVRDLPTPVYTCPNPEAITDKKDVLLYEGTRKVYGKDLPAIAQEIGDCVSWGWKRLVENLLATLILNGQASSFRLVSPEALYALSRVEIGNRRLGNGDGSIGAWMAKAVVQYGVLSMDIHGSHDLRNYSGKRAKKWGYHGLPDELEPIAKEHPVKTVSLVRSYEEAKQAIKSGYPVAVCSNQGFTLTRDSKGFCHPKGRWGHCMEFEGVIESDGDESLVCANSWGPRSPRGPRSDFDLPVNAFRVHAEVADRMLRQGDSFTASAFDGYPPLTVDWGRFIG